MEKKSTTRDTFSLALQRMSQTDIQELITDLTDYEAATRGVVAERETLSSRRQEIQRELEILSQTS